CLIQDMGYYPSGNKFFSDLLHYVRSGDFVMELINDAQDINELAFALGALAHYASDISGHPTVNAAVALEFPRLSKKYGNEVTYAHDPIATFARNLVLMSSRSPSSATPLRLTTTS